MSILIKGMEMPKSCGQCRFFAWSRGVGQHCAVASDITFHATIDGMDVAYERNGDCPLVPVPSHGDLIDRDALVDTKDFIHKTMIFGGQIVYSQEAIDNAPTIIPAEEGE